VDIYGLIGHPVKHSLSPAMHNAAFQENGLDAQYKLFDVSPNKLKDFFTAPGYSITDIEGNSFFVSDIKGFNVTVPYKEAVIQFIELDKEKEYLKKVKAVNTVLNKDGKFKAVNTDIFGFSRDLFEHFDFNMCDAVVLGAGGAARAVTYALAMKARSIAIFDIDISKSFGIKDMIKNIFPNFNVSVAESVEQLNIYDKTLLVNTTPVGMKEGDVSVVDKKMLHKKLFIYDIVYNRKTRLLIDAEEKGLKVVNGLGMLLYQGVLAWEEWIGRPAPVEVMRKALYKEIYNV